MEINLITERIYFEVPMDLKSEANISRHWVSKYRVKKSQQMLFKASWLSLNRKEVPTPCLILLTRHSPRKLDFDNLVYAFKWIRDALADIILPGFNPGRADSEDYMRFEYYQEKNTKKFISVEIIFEKKEEAS